MSSIPSNPEISQVLVIDADRARGTRIAEHLAHRLSCHPIVLAEPPARVSADLILLAPGSAAQKAVDLQRFGAVPVIVLERALDDRIITEWMLAGAEDVATEAELASACVRALARARCRVRTAGIIEPAHLASLAPAPGRKGRLHSLVSFLQAAALTDPLTGLANRRALDARMERAWADSMRDGQDLAILMIDVDNFKRVNDRFGHPFGDALLISLAEALQAQCRKADLAARLGGDEVLVLLPRADAAQALAVADRIRDDFAARAAATRPPSSSSCSDGSRAADATLSIGVASRHSTDSTSSGELLRLADEALYAAKRAGKGCTKVVDRMSKKSHLAAV